MQEISNSSGLIDLHLHTTNSDGIESPEKIICRAKQAGEVLIAITDHNHFIFTEYQKIEGIHKFN